MSPTAILSPICWEITPMDCMRWPIRSPSIRGCFVSGDFLLDAWQMSAVTEQDGARYVFFTRVFSFLLFPAIYYWFGNYPVQQGDYKALGLGSFLRFVAVYPVFGHGDRIHLYCQLPRKHLYGGKKEHAFPGDDDSGGVDQYRFEFPLYPTVWCQWRSVCDFYQLFCGVSLSCGGYPAFCPHALQRPAPGGEYRPFADSEPGDDL